MAVVLVALSLSSALVAQSVPCRTGTAGAIGTKGYLDNGNVRHLSVSIPASWENTAHGNAVIAAIDAWNDKTSSTELRFDPYYTSNGLGGDVAFQMMGGSSNPSCGNYNPGDDRLSLHPELLSAAGSYAAQVEYVIRHELGHVAGLDHTSQSSSAMYAPSYPSCSSSYISGFPTHGISNSNPDDVLAANHCVTSMTSQVANPGADEYEFNGTCWDWYWVTIYYAWNGSGWESVWADWEYLYTDCNPPPI